MRKTTSVQGRNTGFTHSPSFLRAPSLGTQRVKGDQTQQL